MKSKRSHEIRPNDELWQPDPFREPRAWALEWDMTELLKTGEAPELAGSGLFPPIHLYAHLAEKEADARSTYSL